MDVYYNSGFYFTPENKADLKQDAYKLLNARASYLYKPANIRVTAFGKNILSERYHIGLFQTDFGTLSTLAYPVQYGVSLAWNF
jgi:iron complex outermembrane receptor protein